MLELNKIHHGNCLELMKEIPDKSIDLVITDPPYGIGASKYTRGGKQYGNSLAKSKDYGIESWDNEIPPKEVFDEMFRVSKNQIIFGGNYFISYLSNSPCWIVWDKNTGANGYADCELAWTSFKSAVRQFKWTWKGFIQEDMQRKEERYHPTQKPIPLFDWVIDNYSEPNDIILDPFAGSGTTLLACLNKDRRFIGMEKERKYVDVINRRIERHDNQLSFL